jgi:hypothetical protein
MKRYRQLIVAGVVIVAAVVVFQLSKPQVGPVPVPPPAPAIAAEIEFTPAGWYRFREQQASSGTHRKPLEAFLNGAMKAARPLEGYEALDAEDRRDGFFFLAQWLATYEEYPANSEIARLHALVPLIDRHAADYPNDPWVTFFRARELAFRGRFADAEPLFAQAYPALSKDKNYGPMVSMAWADCLVLS